MSVKSTCLWRKPELAAVSIVKPGMGFGEPSMVALKMTEGALETRMSDCDAGVKAGAAVASQ